jgi:hypothetical protein
LNFHAVLKGEYCYQDHEGQQENKLLLHTLKIKNFCPPDEGSQFILFSRQMFRLTGFCRT